MLVHLNQKDLLGVLELQLPVRKRYKHQPHTNMVVHLEQILEVREEKPTINTVDRLQIL